MASASKESADKVVLLGKRKPEDDFKTTPTLKKHKETSEEKETTEGFACTQKTTLYVCCLPKQTKISDVIDFFNDVGEVVHVRLCLNNRGGQIHSGFVEFASANDANKALEKKNGEYLNNHKIFLRVAQTSPYPPPKFCLDHKVWSFQQESLPIEEDETPLVEEVVVVANLSPQTKISHIKSFFSYVGKVVSVRLVVNQDGKHVGYGFVEFASAYEANKALEKKNGEYLHNHKILLMKGHGDTLDLVEDAAITKKLFVANLSDNIKISDIIDFFKDVGEVVHVRLVLNSQGKHVYWGYVEFASANEAKKALVKNGEYLHNRKTYVDVAKTVPMIPPKFSLDHKVWYEDYLRRESLLMGEDEVVEGLDETPSFLEEVAAREKTLFIANLPYNCRIIPKIISFFKDVGKIVHVRIIVDHMNEHTGCGFVEFESSEEAEKALQKKNGEYLSQSKIFLDVVEIAPYPVGPKYNLANKLWYDDNLRRGRQGRPLKTKPKRKVPMTMNVMGLFCGKKSTFSDE